MSIAAEVKTHVVFAKERFCFSPFMVVKVLRCMVRKDDPQFKALVDRSVAAVMKSGEIEKIYAKWFLSPIPPKNINLNFPMTTPIREAFAKPNDKGV